MKKNILLLFFILAGAMVGSLIASAGSRSAHALLAGLQ